MKFYLDTSIWLDFLENRNEPNFPKGDLAKKLISKIINENGKIILSKAVKNELITLGYSKYDIEILFNLFRNNIIEIHTNKKQYGKAKDLKKQEKSAFL